MSDTAPTFDENIADRSGIRSVTVDGMTVTADSVDDTIKADKYSRQLAAQGGALQPHA
jgi:hypothetical protein